VVVEVAVEAKIVEEIVVEEVVVEAAGDVLNVVKKVTNLLSAQILIKITIEEIEEVEEVEEEQ